MKYFSKNIIATVLCLCMLFGILIADAKNNKQIFTKEDLQLFNSMYLKKVKNAKTIKDKEKLADELLLASDEFQGGMHSIILSSAYELVLKSKKNGLPILILEKMLNHKDIESITVKKLLEKLIKRKIKKIAMDKKRLKKEKIDPLNDKMFYALCRSTIDNAIVLCKLCISECDF